MRALAPLVPTSLLCALLCLAFAGPGSAQELPDQDPRARAAQRYQTATWPKPSPSVSGWTPDGLKVLGWDRLRLKVDAKRAEAHLDLVPTAKTPSTKTPSSESATPAKAKAKAALRLRIRRHATPAAARDVLLAHLAACTVTLEREEGLGEVAFGIRAQGRLVYLAGLRGDLSYTLRAEGSLDLQAVASALDTQLRAASKATQAPAAPAATLVASKAGEASPGKPVALALTLKGTAQALFFKAPEGVSVLRTKTGCLVYSERPGLVEFELLLVDKELRTSRHALSVTTR